jgi:VWFA-related protein
LHVLHDFTTDSSLLPEQLARYNFDAWLGGAGVSPQESGFFTENRVIGTSRAIEFMTNHLAGLPGRKNLIWISGGFPLARGFERRTFKPDIDEAVRALDHANVAIYPVDARSLNIHFKAGAAASLPLSTGTRPPVGPTPDSTQRDMQNLRTLIDAAVENELAARTGGRAYVDTNDLTKAFRDSIRDAVNDSALTYTLGFYPDSDPADGKFHKIEVKIPARSGLNLHYRKGYLDRGEQPHDAGAGRVELRDTVWSPVDFSGINVVVQIASSDAAHPNDLNVFLGIDTAGIGFTAEGDRRNGRMDILFVQKDARGDPFEDVNATLMVRLTPLSYEQFRQGLRYQRFVPHQAGATMLRVIVRDASTGSIGSVTVPFDQLR